MRVSPRVSRTPAAGPLLLPSRPPSLLLTSLLLLLRLLLLLELLLLQLLLLQLLLQLLLIGITVATVVEARRTTSIAVLRKLPN